MPAEVQSQLESLSTVGTVEVTRSDAVAYQDKKERDEKEGLETRIKEVAVGIEVKVSALWGRGEPSEELIFDTTLSLNQLTQPAYPS